MSFGLDNLGVINQRNAPAIWESDFADFPTGFVTGRILIDSTTGSIYLDTAITRVTLLQAGFSNFTAENGLTYSPGQDIGDGSNIRLGGTLITANTNIVLDANTLTFQGSAVDTVINSEGSISFTGVGGIVMPIEDVGAGVIVANTRLQIKDPLTGQTFLVPAVT